MVSNITLSSVFHMLMYIFLTFYHSNDICGIVISYPFTFLTFLPVQTKTPIQRHLSRLHFNKCGHVFAFKQVKIPAVSIFSYSLHFIFVGIGTNSSFNCIPNPCASFFTILRLGFLVPFSIRLISAA